MKIYKVTIEDFFVGIEEDSMYLDFNKAREFVISKLNETMNKITLESNIKRFKSDYDQYCFESFEDDYIDKLLGDSLGHHKSINKIGNYILEYTSNFNDILTYHYQIKYSIVSNGEKYTDYNYSIDIKEFEVIE